MQGPGRCALQPTQPLLFDDCLIAILFVVFLLVDVFAELILVVF